MKDEQRCVTHCNIFNNLIGILFGPQNNRRYFTRSTRENGKKNSRSMIMEIEGLLGLSL